MLTSVEKYLKSSFNVSFGCHVARKQHSLEELYPEEQACTSVSWSSQRKLDFINGRLAGHKAMFKLKGCCEPIVKNDTGIPVWSSGTLKGSISHKDNIGVSIVTDNPNIRALGVDLEAENQKMTIEECCLFCKEKELENIKAGKISPILLFSMKEAVFKAYSNVGQVLDFKEIDVFDCIDRCYWWNFQLEDSVYFLVCFIIVK